MESKISGRKESLLFQQDIISDSQNSLHLQNQSETNHTITLQAEIEQQNLLNYQSLEDPECEKETKKSLCKKSIVETQNEKALGHEFENQSSDDDGSPRVHVKNSIHKATKERLSARVYSQKKQGSDTSEKEQQSHEKEDEEEEIMDSEVDEEIESISSQSNNMNEERNQKSNENQEERKKDTEQIPYSKSQSSSSKLANIDPSMTFIQNRRVLSNQTKQEYAHLKVDEQIAIFTQFQILKYQNTNLEFSSDDEFKTKMAVFLTKNSYNFNIVEDLSFLAKGGEAYVFRLEVKQPFELVVKTVLPDRIDKLIYIASMLGESHLIKYLDNKEHVVSIVEELIEIEPKTERITNYFVLVEQPQKDLLTIIKIWASPKESNHHQEYFSQEKAFYLLYSAASALAYCHSKNIYYGDMKPANLLIFRDYSVKLGDFGISIKLSETESEDELYLLKGCTAYYSIHTFDEKMKKEIKVSREELIENDIYTLFKTFKEVKRLFSSQIDSNSYFSMFLKEIKQNQLSSKRKILIPLRVLLEKYQKKVEDDKCFIIKLSQQMADEEKCFAIPHILKLSKHRVISEKIHKYFQQQERAEFSFLTPQQSRASSIEQDKLIAKKVEHIEEDELVSRIYSYITNYPRCHGRNEWFCFYEEFGDFINQLVMYRPSLDKTFIKNLYRNAFLDLYTNSPSLKINKMDDLIADLKKNSDSRREFFKSKENSISLGLFFLFFTKTSSKFLKKSEGSLETSILPIIHNNLEAAIQNEIKEALIEVYIDRESNFQYYNTKQLVLIWSHWMRKIKTSFHFKAFFDNPIAVFNQTDEFQRQQFNSKLKMALKLDELLKTKYDHLIYLREFRTIQQQFYGQLGTEMSENAFEIYNELNRRYNDQEKKDVDQLNESLKFLEKATDYSLRAHRKKYLDIQLEEYFKQRRYVDLIKSMAKHSELFPDSVIHFYYATKCQEYETSVQEQFFVKLLDYRYFQKVLKYINKNNCSKAFKDLLKSETQDHTDCTYDYDAWVTQFSISYLQLIAKSNLKDGKYINCELDEFGILFSGEVSLCKPIGKTSLLFNDGREIYVENINESGAFGEIKSSFPDNRSYLYHQGENNQISNFHYKCEYFQIDPIDPNFSITKIKAITENEMLKYQYSGANLNEKHDGQHTEWYSNGKKKMQVCYVNGQKEGPQSEWHDNGLKKLEETYVYGKREGLSNEWHLNGEKKIEENYSNGQKQGLHIEWNSQNQKRIEESYLNGKLDGFHSEWHPGSFKKIEESYTNGIKNGLQKQWHSNGKQKLEEHFMNGLRDGERTEWHANGLVKTQEKYINGRKSGLCKEWHDNGQKMVENNYYYGTNEGLKTEWFKNGQQKMEINYQKELIEGIQTRWYDNGQKRAEVSYQKGAIDGLKTEWYRKGQKSLEENYVKGRLEGIRKEWHDNGLQIIEQNFFNGKKDGMCLEWHNNGSKKFEESYIDGKKQGLRTEWYRKGEKKAQERFQNGQLEGLTTKWYENGEKKYQANFQNENIEGLRIEWYDNGEKKLEFKYVNGVQDGPSTQWYKDGQKMSDEKFVNGKNQGLRKVWYENGQKKIEENYTNGKRDGPHNEWHQNGEKRVEEMYKIDSKVGPRTEWHKNGKKKTQETYVNGCIEGLSITWDNNGRKILEENYTNGKREGLLIEYLYHENGQIKYIGNLNKTKQYDGEGTLFNQSGEIEYQGKWLNGSRQLNGMNEENV